MGKALTLVARGGGRGEEEEKGKKKKKGRGRGRGSTPVMRPFIEYKDLSTFSIVSFKPKLLASHLIAE